MYNECEQLTNEMRTDPLNETAAWVSRPTIDPLNAVGFLMPRGVDHRERMMQMQHDLHGDDPEARAYWLGIICDFQDDMDVSLLNPDDPDHVRMAQLGCFIHHAMPALQAQNREYFDARYPDHRAKLGVALLGDTQEKFDNLLAAMAYEKKVYDFSDFWRGWLPEPVDSARQQLTSSVANYKIQGFGDTFTSVPFTITENCKRLANQDISKIKAPNPKERDADIALFRDLNGAFGQPLVEATNAGKLKLTQNDLVLIDGKSVNQIMDEKKLNLTPEQRSLTSNKIIASALTSGTHRVDAVYMHTLKDGSLEPVFENIKPDLTALGDTTKQDYSWFHRHLYNYGSHKCLTRAQKQDAIYDKPIPPDIVEKLQSSMDAIDESTKSYNAVLSERASAKRQESQRKPTSAKLLQDEMGPTSTTREQRLSQQQPPQKQANKVL
ncbi:MAG: hypothetical protein RR022_03210 [Angelakisella sp.]